jgi:hypothetical protein
VVIRREHREHGVGILTAHVCGSPGDARGGVAPDRLGEDVLARHAGQRARGRRHQPLVGHDHDPLGRHQRRDPRNRRGDQRLAPARERKELLGLGAARERPEPRAAAAGHDHRPGAHDDLSAS